MEIYIGWWAAPLVVMVISFCIAGAASSGQSSGYGVDIGGVLFGGLALIVSLVAWLIYALAT